jgi:hypothetical protein
MMTSSKTPDPRASIRKIASPRRRARRLGSPLEEVLVTGGFAAGGDEERAPSLSGTCANDAIETPARSGSSMLHPHI